MTRPLTVLALVLTAVAVGCGSDTPSLSQDARAQLEGGVARAEAAAAAHDATSAQQELSAIAARVDALERDSQISSSQAAAIHHAVTRVEGMLDLVTTTTAPPDNGEKGNGKGKGKGKD